MEQRPDEPVDPFGALQPDPSAAATPVREGHPRPQPERQWTFATADNASNRRIIRYDAPVEEEADDRPEIPWGKLAKGFVFIVIIAILAGWAFVRLVVDRRPAPPPPVDPSVSASGPHIDRADDVVRQYLEALSDGDTEKALSLGPTGNGDRSAITPEAYQASLAVQPISNIRVRAADSDSTQVRAEYRIGHTDVETTFKVERDDTGSWRMARTTLTVELQAPNAAGLPVRLNGYEIAGHRAEVLPGQYEVTTGLPFIEFPLNNSFSITNLEYDGTVQRSLTPELTEQGRIQMVNAGRASLAACMNSGSLEPAGCPNRIRAAEPYVPSTVQWSVIGDPFANLNPALEPSDQTVSQASMPLEFQVSFTYQNGSTSGTQTLSPISASYSADLSVRHSSEIQVEWSVAGR